MGRRVYVPKYQRCGGAVVYIAVARWRYGVKIGYSTVPVVRRGILEYECKTPVRLVYATDPIMEAVRVERRSHQLLASAARGGEWFAVDIATAKSVVRRARQDVARGWRWPRMVCHDVRLGSKKPPKDWPDRWRK